MLRESRHRSRQPVPRRPAHGGLQIHALAHPARFFGGRTRIEAEWAAMKDRVRRAA